MNKAWLITWEGDSKTTHEPKIVSILNPKLSGKNVAKFIEQLYIILAGYNNAEKFKYANNRKSNPYKAKFDDVYGLTWEGRIICGHNPYLYGRLVSNLELEKDNEGNEYLVWTEISKDKIRTKIKQLK